MTSTNSLSHVQHQQLRAVLFDLDGTLVDHFRSIYRAYAYAFEKLGLPHKDYPTVRATVGGSIQVTTRRLIGEDGPVEEVLALYREHFDEIWRDDLVVLPGAMELLAGCRQKGWKTAIFTNKEGFRARKVSDYLGLDAHLDLVIGTEDTPWRKPELEFTQHILDGLGVQASEAALIGDSPFDLKTARKAKLPCALVATGTHSKEQLDSLDDPAPVFANLVEAGREWLGVGR